MTSSITYILVTLTIDGVTSFLQLMDVQKYVKIRISVQIRVTGNSQNFFQDCRIIVDSELFVHILNLFLY